MRDGWDDDPEPDSAGELITPQYGGVPIRLNQMLIAAKAAGDAKTEATIHGLRQKLFRNRRSEAQQSTQDIKAQKAWIAKYGAAGEIALKHDAQRKRLATLTPEEQAVIIEAYEAENAPPAKITKKSGGKK